MEHVHQRVLDAANRLASRNKEGVFTIAEVVRALPELNESSVRTHVASRCCIDAPRNHPHKWDYFRRVGRGRYEVAPRYRQRQAALERAPKRRPRRTPDSRKHDVTRPAARDAVHAVVQRDGTTFVAECMEVAVVTQGATLDEVTENLKQALALHLDGEDMAALGLSARPRLRILLDIPLAS
jgi:predicted RNase H-like HicB family nuclease